jgi:hypothetical protein
MNINSVPHPNAGTGKEQNYGLSAHEGRKMSARVGVRTVR